MIETDPTPAVEDVRADVATLYRDGIVARPGAFSREWAEQLRQDMLTAFWEAIQRPGGAVGRGPRRWYIEVHPEAISGFIELVTHLPAEGFEPWLGTAVQLCRVTLRDDRPNPVF